MQNVNGWALARKQNLLSALLFPLAVPGHTTSLHGKSMPTFAAASQQIHSVGEYSRATCSTLHTSLDSHTLAVAGSVSAVDPMPARNLEGTRAKMSKPVRDMHQLLTVPAVGHRVCGQAP
jgi:hypothetical protein